MYKPNFEYICSKERYDMYISERDEYIKRKISESDLDSNYTPRKISTRMMFIMAIRYILTSETLQEIGDRYGISKPVINRVFNSCIIKYNKQLAHLLYEKMFWSIKEHKMLFDIDPYSRPLNAALIKLRASNDDDFSKLTIAGINKLLWHSRLRVKKPVESDKEKTTKTPRKKATNK